MKAAVEHVFNGSLPLSLGAYDKDKISITASAPQLIRQWSTSGAKDDNFLGPMPIQLFRPEEQATNVPAAMVHPIQWSPTQWWLFYADNAAAAANRRVGLYTFDPTTGTQSWKGFVTTNPPSATTHTIRGFRMTYNKITAGTVAVSGTAVTGTSTDFVNAGACVGNRIGFGSTDPTAITTWYEISAVGGATSITLTATAGTIGAGASYVIEDLRAVLVTTNGTLANGGVNVAKGLRFENFTSGGGTSIPAATTVDNIRATYWLKDAAVITNQAAGGCAIKPMDSASQHYIYVVDGTTTNVKCFRYNIRAALSGLASGAQVLTGTDILITGTFTSTGNVSQNNNGRIGALNHGPGSGVQSMYWLTASRIYRSSLATIDASAGLTTWTDDVMTEVPPGGVNTYAATGSMNQLDISDAMDRLVITCTTGLHYYVTVYRTDGGQMTHRFGFNINRLDQGSADASIMPFIGNGILSAIWVEGGIAFTVRQSAAASTNTMYASPIGAHWTYAGTTGQRAILPKINIGTVSKMYRFLANAVEYLTQPGTTSEIGMCPEGLRYLYRTSGIDDNSGAWTSLSFAGDLSGVNASAIQFAIEFRCIGENSIPARVLSTALLYESSADLPAQHQWSLGDSDATIPTWGFTQIALFGFSPPVHTINVYRSDTNALVLTQASSGTTNGVFEYWNGSSWTAGLNTDTVGQRRRFRATGSLPSGVDLYAQISTP
jgi:hypothetical protein